MGGILPLTLSSSVDGRSSVIFNPQPEYLRRLTSTSNSSSTDNMTSSSSQTPQPLPVPKSDLRRQSAFRVPSRGSSVTLPTTTSEWKKAVADVKRKYHSGKYRACSQRCCEIIEALEGGQTTVSTPEPVFLVYLRFYAASSDEMRALPLASPSAMRTRLLKDAQTHYERAASLIHDAEESLEARRSRASSTCSSVSSVPPLSPGLTASSANSTPRTSVCSLDTASIMQSHPPASISKKPKKKKVSFSGLPDLTIEIPKPASYHSQKPSKRHSRKRTNSIPETEEPYIRPDSPTLGWEDDLLMVGGSGRAQHDDEMSYSSPLDNMKFPSPPAFTPKSPSHSPSSSVSSSSPSLPSDDSNLTTPEDRSPITPTEGDVFSPFASLASEMFSFANSRRARQQQDEENWPFPALTPEQKQKQQREHAEKEEQDSQSLDRVCAQLSELKAQVTWHRSAVEDLLNTVTPPPSSSSLSSSPVGSGRNSPVRAASPPRCYTPTSPTGPTAFGLPSRFLSSACSTSRASSSLSCVSSTSSGSASDIAERKERIEKLRSQGWQRKRFDASRYEALREAALGDLARAPTPVCA